MAREDQYFWISIRKPLSPEAGDSSDFFKQRKGGSYWAKDWLVNRWLGEGTFSPQPFRQMADVSSFNGHFDLAEDILYWGKEQELERAKGLNYIKLLSQKCLIGFGYDIWQIIVAIFVATFFGVLF